MKKILLFSLLCAVFSYAHAFNVTFQVDMTSQVGTFTTANINGTFNGWCGGCAAMTDANSDNIWEITIDLAAGTYEYKFTGDGWTTFETLVPGGSCTLTTGGFTNRVITVTGDTVVPVSCWGQCGCVTAHNVTFRVDMTNQVGNFTTANVNGTFNGWCGGCNPLTDVNGDNIWETTIALLPGSYEYKFTGDGWGIQENLVPGSSCTVTNSGYTNRSLTVTGDVVLDVVCYGACVACNAVTGPYDVTFQVDMSNNTDAYSVVNLNGTFNGWCGGCANMTDANGDDIWEITIPLNGGTYEYKFTADGWNFSETLAEGSSCTVTNGGFTNRVFTVTENTTLPVVCYGTCSTCVPPTYDVTFRVDMNNVTDGFTTPEVNGTFNGWCGSCAPMSDANGDNIWELTIPLAAGTYEYKFSADGWGIQETLTEGASCTVNGAPFVNRSLVVTGNTTLSTVCWASCSSCAEPFHPITFQVDMNFVGQSFTTPEVNGTFNGWCGGCAPMSDANGDNIWEITIPLQAGSYEYKFAADGWAIQENLTPGSSCTVTNSGFTNRILNVTGPQTIGVVCWEACQSCNYASNDSKAGATALSAINTYPACNFFSGNLALCTNSAEALTNEPAGAGRDTWYRFVPTTGAMRITANSSVNNLVIELQDNAGNLVASENETTTGSETMVLSGLTIGATYYVAIRNFNVSNSGLFTMCAQHLAVPTSVSPASVNTLCSTIKCQWTGASTYSATLSDGTNTFTTSGSSTKMSLTQFGGLSYNTTYTLVFSATYNLADAAGNPQTITVSSAPVSLAIGQPQEVKLRSTDMCSSTSRALNSYVSADMALCGITNYEWEFIETNSSDVTIGAPIHVLSQSTSRYMQLNGVNIPGIQGGDYYRVKIRAVYPGGQSPWPSTYRTLCITGVAPGMAEENNEEVAWVNADAAAVVYPNPNNGEMFNLNVNGLSDGVWNVQVLDVQGRIVHTEQVVAENGINRTIALNSRLSNGLYTVRLMNGEASLNVRMIVE